MNYFDLSRSASCELATEKSLLQTHGLFFSSFVQVIKDFLFHAKGRAIPQGGKLIFPNRIYSSLLPNIKKATFPPQKVCVVHKRPNPFLQLTPSRVSRTLAQKRVCLLKCALEEGVACWAIDTHTVHVSRKRHCHLIELYREKKDFD